MKIQTKFVIGAIVVLVALVLANIFVAKPDVAKAQAPAAVSNSAIDCTDNTTQDFVVAQAAVFSLVKVPFFGQKYLPMFLDIEMALNAPGSLQAYHYDAVSYLWALLGAQKATTADQLNFANGLANYFANSKMVSDAPATACGYSLIP